MSKEEKMNKQIFKRGKFERRIELLVGVCLTLVVIIIVSCFILWLFWPNLLPYKFGMGITQTSKTSTMLLEKVENGKSVVSTITKEFAYPKTLWDWLELIVVPATLALAALWLSYSQRQNELGIAEQQREEDMLRIYYGDIADYISDLGLGTSNETSGVRALATARTKTLLTNINGRRKGQIIQFLYEAKMLGFYFFDEDKNEMISPAIINLEGTDLSGIDLEGAGVEGIYLKETILKEANLAGVIMDYACLRGAALQCADIQRRASFYKTDLNRADLRNIKWDETTLINTSHYNDNTQMSSDLEQHMRPGKS